VHRVAFNQKQRFKEKKVAKKTMIRKKKEESKYCLVWSGDFNCQDVTMAQAKEQAIEDVSCIDKNIGCVYICKIVKKVKRCVEIIDVK